jgi:hypothetical protein
VLELMWLAFCVTWAKLAAAMGSSSKLSNISVWGTPKSSRNNSFNSPLSRVKHLSWSVCRTNMLYTETTKIWSNLFNFRKGEPLG